MKKTIVLLALVFGVFSFGLSQNAEYRKTVWPSVSKIKTVNFGQLEDDFLPSLVHVEAPSPSGHLYRQYLHDLKQEIATKYPKDYSPMVNTRGDVDPPVLGDNFIVGGIQPGIPLDNHLAMNNDTLVSGVNSFVSVQTTEGSFVKNFSLLNLAMELNVALDRLFDPRLLFDPVANRYVAVFLGGFNSSDTNIIVCFSATSDPSGEWHAYAITGNPNGDATWTDYPMIQFTETDIQITINLLRDGESWQLGFEESLIWQIDKETGYAGEDLNIVLWDDISFMGAPIRNLCPVESGTGEPLSNSYYLSDRNFSIENDTFFILEVTAGVNDADSELIIDYVLSDIPYAVPPNATQEVGELQTNDARVLEAFIVEDQIQFVGNSRNLDNNQAGIFHGILNDLNGARNISLTHIIGEDYEIGYPGITYTGDGVDERDAIIAFDHTSATRFAGMSAMYFVEGIGYSDIITLKEGEGYIDMLNGTLERWGDYLGTQRNYNNPDEVWVSGFYSRSNGNNHPWIAQLTKPQEASSTEDIETVSIDKVFPNPIADRFTVEFMIPTDTKHLKIDLLSIDGKVVAPLYSAKPKKTGESEFSFSIHSLETGSYVLMVSSEDRVISSQTVVVK
jgi:hypothetical protein